MSATFSPEIGVPQVVFEPEPPMTHDQLVDAKWGLSSPSQRELAEAALYYYDQAFKWQIMAKAGQRA